MLQLQFSGSKPTIIKYIGTKKTNCKEFIFEAARTICIQIIVKMSFKDPYKPENDQKRNCFIGSTDYNYTNMPVNAKIISDVY